MGEQIVRARDDAGNVHDLATLTDTGDYALRVVDEDVYAELQNLATQATLAAIETLLSNEDFAQDTTLQALKTAFDAEDFASQTTLASIDSKVATNAQLTTLTDELSALHADLGDIADADTANTVIGRLKKIVGLLNSLDSKDFATQTTLAALNTNFVGEDFAQEATLSGLRTDFQNEDFASETTLQALETVITTIRDEQHRRTDSLAAGTNLIGYVSSNAVRLSSLGRVFIGTSDELNAGLGQDINATISNPAGSGVNMLLVRITATSESSGGLVVGDVLINPTTNLPTTAYTPFCTAVGAASAQGEFKVNTSNDPISGGQTTDLHIGLVGSGRMVFDLEAPVIISPGVTLGLTIPLGALESTAGTFAAYWIEEPA